MCHHAQVLLMLLFAVDVVVAVDAVAAPQILTLALAFVSVGVSSTVAFTFAPSNVAADTTTTDSATATAADQCWYCFHCFGPFFYCAS